MSLCISGHGEYAPPDRKAQNPLLQKRSQSVMLSSKTTERTLFLRYKKRILTCPAWQICARRQRAGFEHFKNGRRVEAGVPFSSFTQDRHAFRPTQDSKYERHCYDSCSFASAKRSKMSKNNESMVRNGRLPEFQSNNNYSLEVLIQQQQQQQQQRQ